MSKQAQIPLEAGVMQITLGTFTGDFFVAAMPEQKKAIAITGLVSDEKNHDESMEDARRIAACWNVCRGFDTTHLENIDMLGDTLKRRFESLQAELRQTAAEVTLTKKHEGMRVDYTGMIGQAVRSLKLREPFKAEMLRQLADHLAELGKRFYAGDIKVVDEFLQLYCVADEDRERVVAEQSKEAA